MSSDEIVYTVTDTLGRRVILKQSVLDDHTSPDRGDARVRHRVFTIWAPKVLRRPTTILHNSECDTRIRFISEIPDTSISDSLKSVVVVVETASDPNEIVTAMIVRNLKKQDITKGVIYSALDDTSR